jgi:hypothetical protein
MSPQINPWSTSSLFNQTQGLTLGESECLRSFGDMQETEQASSSIWRKACINELCRAGRTQALKEKQSNSRVRQDPHLCVGKPPKKVSQSATSK